jgi:RNA polymerase sigma-70 factor (ECF subfamily)
MSHQAWSIVFAQLSPHGADDGGPVGRGRSGKTPAASASLSASDTALVRQIRDGNIDAFESMFHAEYQGLVTYLARMVGTTWDAEELVQGMFVQLWERRTTFAPRTSVRTYLYGAARHAALNHFRAARRPPPPAGTGHAGASSLADVEVELRDLERAAVTAMLALPPRAREVWTLHREQGLTVPEIASHLGISPNTVKTQLARSLVAIREAVLPFLVVVLAIWI